MVGSSKFRFVSRLTLLAVVVSYVLTVGAQPIYAATLTAASMLISDPRPSGTAVTYTLGFTFPGTTAISCIEAKFTTTAQGSTVPTGIVTTAAAKGTLTGGGLTTGSWVTTDVATNGTIRLKHATTQATTATAFTLSWTGITNTSTAGTFYATMNTYTASGACSTLQDTVAVALATTAAVTVSATIDPALTFTVANVGADATSLKTSVTTSTGCAASTDATHVAFPSGANAMVADTDYTCGHLLTTTTNGSGGFTTTIARPSGSNTLTSGANSITEWTGTNATPTAWPSSSTAAFGYTSNVTPLGTGTTARFGDNNVWAGASTSALEIDYSNVGVSAHTAKIGYRVRFTPTTLAGAYTGTILYTCTPIF